MIKILVIEDDATMRSLLQTLLQLEGYSVSAHIPTTMEEVLQAVGSINPEAIILDVHLKNLNGLDVVRKLRQSTFFHGRVIMASGMELDTECKTAGADQFFLKPYMPDDLINWLKCKLQTPDLQ